MPIFKYKCPICQHEERFSDKASNDHPHCGQNMVRQFSAPGVKFMEKKHPEKGGSIMKDQQRILKERTRSYSRDNELDDLIQTNDKTTAKQHNWVGNDGRARKKIDDI